MFHNTIIAPNGYHLSRRISHHLKRSISVEAGAGHFEVNSISRIDYDGILVDWVEYNNAMKPDADELN